MSKKENNIYIFLNSDIINLKYYSNEQMIAVSDECDKSLI